MEYLIRFAQVHETFRLPEIQSLAVREGINIGLVEYSLESPFCIVRLPSEDAAKRLVRRAILVQGIFELWGSGKTLEELHASVRSTSSHLWERYRACSFKYCIDSYQGARPGEKKLEIFKSFSYIPLDGEIKMNNPDQEFTVFEDWPFNSVPLAIPHPNRYFMGRRVEVGGRDLPKKLDLKKRRYISTTSMDAELSLVSANMVLAGPGKLMYDPFAGTGSFPLACAEFGSLVFGSDLDGRSMRGKDGERTLRANFDQYGLLSSMGGFFTADLTNTPVRRSRAGGSEDSGRAGIFDGILCDPPYGVREGLYVLGVRDKARSPHVVEVGMKMYKDPDFVPPRKPYSFLAMLDDILEFAAETLVDGGRLAFWMPTANDEEQEIPIPTHPYLEIVFVSVQVFNKWSRRLITFQRLPNSRVDPHSIQERAARAEVVGVTADELNPFRRGYFTKFVAPKT